MGVSKLINEKRLVRIPKSQEMSPGFLGFAPAKFSLNLGVNFTPGGNTEIDVLREVNNVTDNDDEKEKSTVLSSSDEEANPLKVEEWAYLRHQVTLLAQTLETMRLAEYIAYLNRPGRLLLINFLVGLVRGLGTALGAGLLAGVAYFLLKRIVVLNLPVIGGLIAELSKYVHQP